VKKYTYIVLKSFTIIEENGKNRITKEAEARGHKSRFSRNANYLDYEFPDRDLTQSRITAELVQKGYIKLVSEVKV